MIDDRSQINIEIRYKKGHLNFEITYCDQIELPINKLRGYDQELITSLVDTANCLSWKKYPYDICYKFLTNPQKGRSSSLGIESRTQPLDLKEEWTISYNLQDNQGSLEEKVIFEGLIWSVVSNEPVAFRRPGSRDIVTFFNFISEEN